MVRMRADDDLVPFSLVEVQDDIITPAFDPMVMDIVILAGHATPVYPAILTGIFVQHMLFGIEQGPEFKPVTAGNPARGINQHGLDLS